MIARVAIFILFTIAFTVTGLSAQPGFDVSRISPHPSLKPVDVVRIVMTALQHNDIGGKNRGIAITYNFASPANKRMTKTLSRFIALVVGRYMEVINHKGASYEKVILKGQNAQVDVIIRTVSAKFKGFRFTLSRQQGNPHQGSWMTDSVVPFNVSAT